MSGRGFPPKDPERRARRNKDGTPRALLRFVRADQPPLPDDIEWHPRTVAWWENWRTSPQADHFMVTDWDFLLDTARLFNAMWTDGDFKLAAEVRLRVAKFGATPEDRARLRMQFAQADEADANRQEPAGADPYGHLRVVGTQDTGEGA